MHALRVLHARSLAARAMHQTNTKYGLGIDLFDQNFVVTSETRFPFILYTQNSVHAKDACTSRARSFREQSQYKINFVC